MRKTIFALFVFMTGILFALFAAPQQNNPENVSQEMQEVADLRKQTEKKVTPSGIMALVHKAVQLINEKGLDAALPVLADPKGPYINGDVYVFAYTYDGSLILNPCHRADEGRRLINHKDIKGNPFIAYFVEIAKGPDHEGWSEEYWMTKPGGKEPVMKVSYIVGIPKLRIFVGAGLYGMTKLEAQNSIE